MKLKNIVRTYQTYGVKGILRAIFEKVNEYWYETRFSLDCRGRIEIDELNKSVKDELYHKYGVVFASAKFEWIKKGIDSLPIDHKKATLLDLGSGKGRVTCYALQRGFKKVICVEWSPQLALISESNLEKLSNSIGGGERDRWSIINGDASEYTIPKEVDVIWLFNPFTGPILEKVLNNIKTAGHYKKLYIIFANPPKEELAAKYIALVKKIRPNYPRLFLYETYFNNL